MTGHVDRTRPGRAEPEGGPLTDTDVVAITVNAVNDRPVSHGRAEPHALAGCCIW